MGTPTAEELSTALKEAGRMREQGEDPHFIAKSLLNHHFRLRHLEHVHDAVICYMRSGTDQAEHSKLVRVLEEYRRAMEHPGLSR